MFPSSIHNECKNSIQAQNCLQESVVPIPRQPKKHSVQTESSSKLRHASSSSLGVIYANVGTCTTNQASSPYFFSGTQLAHQSPLSLSSLDFTDSVQHSVDSGGDAVEPVVSSVTQNEIFDACKNGNLMKLKRLINSNNVNVRDTGGGRSSSLHFAAGFGRLDVVEFLLSQGACIQDKDDGGLGM